MIKTILKDLSLLAASVFFFVGCANPESKVLADQQVRGETVRDRSITKELSYSNLFLDSLLIESYISEHGLNDRKADYLRDFYRSRNYQFAWFAADGLDEHGRAFWNLHNNFLNYSQDSSLFNRQLHRQMEVLINDEEEAVLGADKVTQLELGLSEHFFDYAHFAFAGKVDPSALKWNIPRKKINAVALLDSLVLLNGEKLDQWEPLNQQYRAMRKEVLRYHQLEKNGGWPKIAGAKKLYKLGDSSQVVQQLKKRLRMTGDYANDDQSPVFTQALELAVMKAQKRFGLKQDGVVGPATLRELNKPVADRIKQMLLNMERMRWMPAHTNGKRLVANIPEYKLHVYEGAREVFNMRIVVGKAANKTVVFNDQLKHIVFSPYWNIPRSIVRNEILPAMKQNPAYLAQKNMEQTGTSGDLPVIRQKPGANNALGRVKFLFPNSYAIYFHDTPARLLFERDKRAFSHGCIRLEAPQRLAEYLLQDTPGWDESRITDAMYAGKEKWVTLDEPVPVAITYFTSWADEEGEVHFRDDIYGHDKALAEKLFD